jgi:hypothetical protein
VWNSSSWLASGDGVSLPSGIRHSKRVSGGGMSSMCASKGRGGRVLQGGTGSEVPGGGTGSGGIMKGMKGDKKEEDGGDEYVDMIVICQMVMGSGRMRWGL